MSYEELIQKRNQYPRFSSQWRTVNEAVKQTLLEKGEEVISDAGAYARIDPQTKRARDLIAAEQPRLDILEEIKRLEGEITNRRHREAILGTDNGWLANQDARIAAQRAKL